MRAWISRGILALVVLFIVADVCLLYPPARLLAYYVGGRAGCCGFRESMEANEYLQRRAAAVSLVRNSVHRISIDGRLAQWETPQGTFWVPARDAMGFVPILAEQELRVYGRIQKGDIVLDCGANIGDFTRSALADGAGMVVSIEISPDTIECLRRNLKDELATGRAVLVTDGVWDRDSKLRLYTSKIMGSGVDTVTSHDQSSVEGPEVNLTTIDKIVERLHLSRVDVIKLDVEGAEFRGLVGARETIRKYHPRIAFDAEDFTKEDVGNIQAELDSDSMGYRSSVGPCIDLRTSIRADIVRFEYKP